MKTSYNDGAESSDEDNNSIPDSDDNEDSASASALTESETNIIHPIFIIKNNNRIDVNQIANDSVCNCETKFKTK